MEALPVEHGAEAEAKRVEHEDGRREDFIDYVEAENAQHKVGADEEAEGEEDAVQDGVVDIRWHVPRLRHWAMTNLARKELVEQRCEHKEAKQELRGCKRRR